MPEHGKHLTAEEWKLVREVLTAAWNWKETGGEEELRNAIYEAAAVPGLVFPDGLPDD